MRVNLSGHNHGTPNLIGGKLNVSFCTVGNNDHMLTHGG